MPAVRVDRPGGPCEPVERGIPQPGLRLVREREALRAEIDKTSIFEGIVGDSVALMSLLSRASKVAGTDATVLITLETGTGKELVARAIHRRSRVALLRVLQEREFERVGGRERIHADIRVMRRRIVIDGGAGRGTFRQDLFYRLNVFPIEIPPLRQRRDDIRLLAEYFIGCYARKAGKTFRRVSERTLNRLQSYPWPRNVRELQNIIERSVIVSDTDELTVDER